MGHYLMDIQTILNLGFAGAGALCGWILRVVWQEIKLVQANQKNLKENLPIVMSEKMTIALILQRLKGCLTALWTN